MKVPVVVAMLLLGLVCWTDTAAAQAMYRNTFMARPRPIGPAPAQSPVGVNQNAPNWWQLEQENQPMDYNLYWGPSSVNSGCDGAPDNCELMNFTGDNAVTPVGVQRVRPPASYYVINNSNIGKETSYGGCPLPDGSFVYPPSSMFTISPAFYNAKGLVMQGYIGGGSAAFNSPSGAYSVTAAYVSSNRCSASDQEYGFYADTTKSNNMEFSGMPWVFYYSLYTNTPQQQNSSPANTAVVTNINYSTPMLYYQMWIIPVADSPTQPWSPTGYDFRVQIIDQNYNLVKCQINNGPLCPCTTDLQIGYVSDGVGNQTLWPVAYPGVMAGTSYLVAGTQTSNWEGIFPNYSCPTCYNGSWINGLWLGF